MTGEHPKKLFLLDAMALVYRAYFAFSSNHRVNSKGLNTSAMFGFTNTLLEVLKKEKPTHIAVVFDTPEPTVRHEEYKEYKAHREEVPEDIIKAIPYIEKIIEAFKIPVIKMPGYEADDIIGTLAKKAEEKGYIVYMMTPDKDYGQLVSENILIYKPARAGNGAEILGVKEVCNKWEIKNVDQVIEVLGLMGDAVDNIPGIPGVGEKTAIKLIKEYASIDGLYNNLHQLKGKLKEKVENNKELAYTSKKLATIIIDVPVELDENSLITEEPDKEKLKQVFAELEFRRLAAQILGEDTFSEDPVEPQSGNGQMDLFGKTEQQYSTNEPPLEEEKKLLTINDVPHNYILIDTIDKRSELIKLLMKQSSVCFDTETTSLDSLNAEIVGLSFAFEKHTAYYVPFPENQTETINSIHEFKSFFECETIEKVGQNIKYDSNILYRYGIHLKGKLFDTMIAHFLIRPDMRHNMDVLSETYLNYSPVPIESLIGKKGKNQLSMRMVPIDLIKEYAAEDADITMQLKEKFISLLTETNNVKLFEEVEMPLMPVLADMEREGIKLDIASLKEYSKDLEIEIEKENKSIQEMAGTPFNISSPKQVGEILFEVLKIVDKPKKTKTGQYATSEDILSKLVNKHPIVSKILEYRELVKLKSTYVDALPAMADNSTMRIHTSFNQVVAVTGRLSSDNPNLQNIPIKTAKGREIRKSFVPKNQEYLLLSADYSQIELRIMAALSEDASMMEAFNNNEDIHTATAAKVYGVSMDKVGSDMRRNAKMVNFGIIYGISAFGLAERLNIPRKEAAEIIENYFKQYPGVKIYMDNCISKARKNGFVETVLGRKRYLPDILSTNATVRGFAERNAINAPIQGSAADMIKIAMINIQQELKKHKFKTKMLLQVHDELVFDMHKSEEKEVKFLIEDKMKSAINLKVPIEVGMGTGVNWLEAH